MNKRGGRKEGEGHGNAGGVGAINRMEYDYEVRKESEGKVNARGRK